MPETLITGATGFVGQHLLKALVSQGRKVVCLVRPQSDIAAIEQPGVRIFRADLCNQESLMGCCQNIETVFHVAGHASLRTQKKDALLVNTLGTRNLLEEITKSGTVTRFIYISSLTAISQTRGKKLTHPITDPCNAYPDTAYGQSKREAEQCVLQFAKQANMPYTILRPAMIYGPGSRPDAGINAITQAITSNALIGRLNLPGTFSLIYIGDLIRLCLNVEKNPKAINQTYLVCDGQPITFGQLIHQIRQQINCPSPLVKIPGIFFQLLNKTYDVLDQFLHVSRIVPSYLFSPIGACLSCMSNALQKELDFIPQYSLSEGLAETLRNDPCA